MANEDVTAAAIAKGRKKADEILARREIARARRANVLAKHPGRHELNVQVASTAGPVAAASLQTAGFLLAAGDSWFDYPFHDVLKLLEDNYGSGCAFIPRVYPKLGSTGQGDQHCAPRTPAGVVWDTRAV